MDSVVDQGQDPHEDNGADRQQSRLDENWCIMKSPYSPMEASPVGWNSTEENGNQR